MSVVYKTKFLQALRLMITRGDVLLPVHTDTVALFNILYQKAWVVYAKAPFSGPHTVIEYLGRYTHKVAISNHRIKSINEQEDTVTFDYKDYANGGTQKQMILSGEEFIRLVYKNKNLRIPWQQRTATAGKRNTQKNEATPA